MLSLSKQFEIVFEKDVYIARVQSIHNKLMVNSGYHGVMVVDVLVGQPMVEISFSNVVEHFSIQTWLVSPDGKMSYLFPRDNEPFALEIDHEKARVSWIGLHPDFHTSSGLCGFSPELHLQDDKGDFWILQNARLVPVITFDNCATRLLEIRKQLGPLGVLKMGANNDELYVMDNYRIGYISLQKKADILVPHDGKGIDVSHYRGNLIVCLENEILQWKDGRQSSLLKPSSDEYFMTVDVIEIGEVGYLNILCAKQDGMANTLKNFQIREHD